MKSLKRWIIMALVLSMLGGTPIHPQAFAAEDSDAVIYDLMTNDLVDPVGLDENPVFSWKMRSDTLGQKQTAYQVVVKQADTVVWDSGKVADDRSVGIAYAGSQLRSSTAYTWSVTVWDKDGKTAVSPQASFETALLEENAFADTHFISYQPAADITSYILDVDFVITKGAVSPVFGAQDEANFIMWQINASKNQIRPHFREGGAWVAYPGKTGSAYAVDAIDISETFTGLNDPHHLRIVVDGTNIETWLGADPENLTKIGTYTHTKAIHLGRIGVRQAKNESGWFDDLTVTDLKGNVLYRNSFTDGAANDIAIASGSISDGWLKMDGAQEAVCLQKSTNNAPAFRKSITVKEGLQSAKLYTAGLGVYESYINGQRVGRLQADGSVSYDELKPGFTQRNKRQFYSSYDVTWMLTQGENVLGGVVTGGWWTGVGSLFRGTETAYLAKLILTYEDGSQEIIHTDTSWKSAKMAAVQASTGIYAGERYDATVDQSWMLPGFDDSTWAYAKVNTEFTGTLDAWDGVSVTVREDLERTPQTMTVYSGATGAVADESYGDITVLSTHTDGESIALTKGQTLLVDFGQNFAGWEYFEIEGAKGTVVTVEHGEWLNEAGGSIARGNDGPGGSIYNANYRTATANTIYTMAGSGVEAYHPSFSFYGFRYIEITATADITVHKVRGQVVTSVHNDTATMVTSDANVNQLLSNIRWGMYSNYLSVPTDCPQRNERHGWTGDTQVFSQAGTYLTYSKSFLEKYLQDMRDAQRGSDGAYSDIAPYTQNYGSSPNADGTVTYGEVGWGDAGIIIPWTLYMMYGDTTTVTEHWASMRKYMDGYMESTNGNGPTSGAKDHLNLENTNKQPVGDLLGVAFFAWDALMMADMANAIGDTEAAAHYMGIYEREKQIFQERFVREDGTLTRFEQTAMLYALYLDLLPDEASVAAVTNDLVSSIESYGNKMYTGFLGTSIITKTLTKIGRADLAYTLLLQHDYPSWLYSVDQGATTIWERWNTYTADSGFGDVSMNSFNHYSYGAVAGWMYQTLAGIGYDTQTPGFKNILLAPAFDTKITSIQSSYESVYGTITTQTDLTGESWSYKATIPANTTATAKIPLCGKVLKVNGKALAELSLETDGIVYTGTENDTATFRAVAGSFTFTLSHTVTQLDWSKPQYCEHCDDSFTWKAYTTAENLTEGHYYLANDITSTLTDGIGAASNGKMSCVHLNGHTITCTTGNRVFNVAKNRTLNIMDHPENLGVLVRDNSKGSRGGIFNITDTGVVNMYGGTAMLGSGQKGSYGCLVYLNGTCSFTMYGGVLKNGNISTSVATKDGGSIYADGNAVITVNGGLIQDGNAPSYGGNIYLKSAATLTVNGGTITGGTAGLQGGNIYASGTATVAIHGGSILGGTSAVAGGNIHMASGTTLTIDEDRGETLIKLGNAPQGGNIDLVGAAATLDAGEVSYGYASGTASTTAGGNVRIDADSSFTMNQDPGKETLVTNGRAAASGYGGNIHNYGTFTMNDGKLIKGDAGSAASNLTNRKTARINGGYIGDAIKGSSVVTMSAGTTYVTGGIVSGLLQDGTAAQSIRVWDSGKLCISGGQFLGGQVVADKAATLEVSGGDLTNTPLSFVLHKDAKGDGTLSVSGGNLGKVTLGDNCESYDIQVTLSGSPVIASLDRGAALVPVTVSGLTQDANVTFVNETEGTVFGTGDAATGLYSDGLVAALEETSLVWRKSVAAVGERQYADLQTAIDNAQGGYVQLVDNVTGDVTLTGDTYLDLAGFTLTGNVSGEGTLYGMDSSGDTYELPTGRIEGAVSCQVADNFKTGVTGNIRRYLTIADESGYTFHRIYLGITHMSLKPSNTGVGYKAVFGADSAVQALLDETDAYGFTLWVGDGEKHSFAKEAAAFETGDVLTLRLQNFDPVNYGETPVYGQVFLKLSDGRVMESSTYHYTLRGLLEQVAANAASFSAQQIAALQAMIEENPVMKTWSVEGLYN